MTSHYNDLGQEIGYPLTTWKPCNHPPKTEIYGQYCHIVLLSIEKHAKALYESYSKNKDHRQWTYLPYGPFDGENGLNEFKKWLKESCIHNDPLFHCVIDIKTNKAVGLLSLMRIQPEIGVIEVGHVHFSPLMQGTRLSTEALYLLMRRVFDELGYRRYEWKCDTLNTPSKNAANRLGFTLEGVFRQSTTYKGRTRDTAWFSIINNEWPKLKKQFESWLNPENFNENGQQIHPLSFFKEK